MTTRIPNDTEVICPACTHQFRAIPVQVQGLLKAAGYEPPFLDGPAAAAPAGDSPFQDLLQSWDKLADSIATSDWEEAYRQSRANAAKELRAAMATQEAAQLVDPRGPGYRKGFGIPSMSWKQHGWQIKVKCRDEGVFLPAIDVSMVPVAPASGALPAMPGTYRKKPVVIQAWKIDLDADQPDWVKAAFQAEAIDWDPAGEGLWINTLEGAVVGQMNDMLVQGVQGELYPCRMDIFETSHEAAALASPQVAPQPDEQSAFESWLEETCPSGDVTEVQRQWEKSAAYQDFFEALAAPAPVAPAEPSPTSGMSLAQRILHVGGRNNAAGYVEFGSTQAVDALVRQVLRDLPAAPTPDLLPTDAMIHAAVHAYDVSQATPMVRMRCALSAALARWVAPTPAQPSEDLWYLQDTRSYVGNDVLWWAKDGNGYTTDVSKAHAYTREKAFRLAAARGCDRAWPKAYIDGKTRPAVDMQYIDHAAALATLPTEPEGQQP
jgi:hypothetical protein